MDTEQEEAAEENEEGAEDEERGAPRSCNSCATRKLSCCLFVVAAVVEEGRTCEENRSLEEKEEGEEEEEGGVSASTRSPDCLIGESVSD